jgi:hypothetical protein
MGVVDALGHSFLLGYLGIATGGLPNTVEATSIASIHSGLYVDRLIMVDGLRWLCRPVVIWGHSGSSWCWLSMWMDRDGVRNDDGEVLEVREGARYQGKCENGSGCCCAAM